jgi:uncharacterized membrane-anchored protein|tara:strand:- start:806 stop:2131 length:1326 start_codon:yes stop_codon:yes gene_type:complete
MGFEIQEHALRRKLSDELHARSFHEFEGGGRFIRFIFMTESTDETIIEPINRFLKKIDTPQITSKEKFKRVEMASFSLRIERHNEFVTIGFIVKGEKTRTGLAEGAFDPEVNETLPFRLIEEIPAKLFHAIWLEIGGKPPKQLTPAKVQNIIKGRSGASSLISGGEAQVHFSFDIDSNGFSRSVLFNNAIPASRLGRIVLRMVELETYRMLALLGLPTATQYINQLGQTEQKLSDLTHQLTAHISSGDEEVQELLPELSQMAAKVEQIAADTSYRLAATKAYRDIFLARMDALRTSRLDGHQGLKGFLDRRMMPAMQTCVAFGERLANLSERIARAGSLLRTQTETNIQRQNRDLLASMNRRAKAQLRLQQTIEGLSVAAVTYYGVGLVGHVAKALPLQKWGLDITLFKALAVPLVALLVWMFLRKVRKAVYHLDELKTSA